MDRTAIRDEVRLLLRETDTSNTAVSDTEINSTIDRVLPLIALKTQNVRLTYCEYTTADGTQSYALPSDFIAFKHVELERSTSLIDELTWLSIDQFHHISHGSADQTEVPKFYKVEYGAVLVTNATQIPGDVWLYPIPDDNGGANYTLRMRYFQGPTALTDDAHVPQLPIFAHMLIPLKAASLLAIKKKDPTLKRMIDSEYQEHMIDVMRQMNTLNRDRGREIEDVRNYTEMDW
jgi:hypothetical protein